MTPTSPTWDDIADFLDADAWRRLDSGRKRHVFYEKTLDDGRVLQTHISHSGRKFLSPGRFGSILCHQLEVSRAQFWECIRTRKPVERPAELEAAAPEHEPWVVAVLTGELHLTSEEIEALSEEEAQRLVRDHWSKPS